MKEKVRYLINKVFMIVGLTFVFFETKSQDLPFIYIGVEIKDCNLLLKPCQQRIVFDDSAADVICIGNYNCLGFDSITSIFKKDCLIQLKLYYKDSQTFTRNKIYADKFLHFVKKNEIVAKGIKTIYQGYKRGHCHYDLITSIDLSSNIESYEIAIYDKNSFIYKR